MTTALVIIDMQMLMQERIESGRDYVNPEAPDNIAALAKAFRHAGSPVIHVRHQDSDPSSPLHPDAPGYQTMACAEALEGEAVFVKTVSSGFTSTGLEAYLRDSNISHLVVTGAVADFCVSSTVRAGADLGFKMSVVRDAVIGFGLPSSRLSARVSFDVTMAQLESDFAELMETSALLPG